MHLIGLDHLLASKSLRLADHLIEALGQLMVSIYSGYVFMLNPKNLFV